MIDTPNFGRLPDLDDPWRRLPWIILTAVSLWITLLAAFSFLLERSEPPPAELKPLEARIIELPPVGGLAGGGAALAQPAAAAVPKPRVIPHPHPAPVVKPRPKAEPPPMPVSPNGTATTSAAPEPSASSGTGATEGGGSAVGNGGGGGGGTSSGDGSGNGSGPGGIGSDSLGARAVYAPVPEIPDDLREDAMQTVAVARFNVSYDGQVTVTLLTKTESPRLNRILVDTLQKWRFFPATRNGVAIDSQFDLKIPVTVQ